MPQMIERLLPVKHVRQKWNVCLPCRRYAASLACVAPEVHDQQLRVRLVCDNEGMHHAVGFQSGYACQVFELHLCLQGQHVPVLLDDLRGDDGLVGQSTYVSSVPKMTCVVNDVETLRVSA